MNFIAMDVETTGTLSYVDHIVELAAVRFTAKTEGDCFSALVNPGVPMPEEASRVNGITDEMLKDKPPIGSVLKDFSGFCSQYPLVAHNAVFDFQFLSQAFEKNHCAPPLGLIFDTYTLSKKVFPGLSNYKLSTLIAYLKIPISGFHRARQDAYACGKLFKAILKKTNMEQNMCSQKLTELMGRKALKFPPLKAYQLSLFE